MKVTTNLLPPVIISIFSGYIGAWIVYKWGERFGFVDKPTQRSSHQKVTPKGAGIGLLFTFCVLFVWHRFEWMIGLSVIGLALLSLLDDRLDLSVLRRLQFQFLATGLVLKGLNVDRFVEIGPFQDLMTKGVVWIVLYVLLALFIIGTSNFYNFMDGIDGIAAITGIVAFGLIASVSWNNDQLNMPCLLAIGMSVSCFGFLPFNFPSAKVFMGDVGSILLGFTFSVLVLWVSNNWNEVLCFAGFLFPFYADETLSILERIIRGEALTIPHRRHLYQVLANEYNIAHWKISIFYGLFQLLVGILLIQMKDVGIVGIIGTLFLLFCGFSFINFKVKKKLQIRNLIKQ